jgi:hypothetical protein
VQAILCEAGGALQAPNTSLEPLWRPQRVRVVRFSAPRR